MNKYMLLVKYFARLGYGERMKMLDGMQIEELEILCEGFRLALPVNGNGGQLSNKWVIHIDELIKEKKSKMRDDKLTELGL